MEQEHRKSDTPTFEFGKLWLAIKQKYKKKYIWTAVVTFFGVWALALCVPNYYVCKVTLVPESGSSTNSMGSLMSLASSFGCRCHHAKSVSRPDGVDGFRGLAL